MGLFTRQNSFAAADAVKLETSAERKLLVLSEDVSPLEPRLMLDATLAWDLSDTDAMKSVAVFHDLVEAQVSQYSNFVQEFESKADTAVAALNLFAGQGNSFEQGIDVVVDALRKTVDAFKSGFDATVGSVVIDTDAEKNTFADKINALLLQQSPNYQNVADDKKLSADDLDDVFSVAAMRTGQIDANIDALANTLHNRMVGAATDLPSINDIKTALKNEHQALLNALGSDANIELVDITSDNGDTLVSFSQSAGITNSVSVEVNAPTFDIDVGAVLGASIGEQFKPVLDAVSDTVANKALKFDIVTDLSAPSSAGGSQASLEFNNFEMSPLLSFGGDGMSYSGGAGVNLGLLSVDVEAINMAAFQTVVSGLDSFAIGASAGLDSGASIDIAPIDSFGIATQVKVVGEDSFVDVEDGEHYDVISVDLKGDVGFTQQDADTTSDRDFTANLAGSIVLRDSSVSTISEQIKAAAESVKVAFDVQISESTVSDAQLRGVMEDTVENLAALGAGQIKDFLAVVGFKLDALFRSAIFDVDIPFTDLELKNVFSAVGGLFSSIDDEFKLPASYLGFGDDVPLSDYVSTDVTDVRVQEFNFAALSEYSELHFVAATEGAGGELDLQDISVDLSGLSLTAGGGASQAEALVEALNAALSAVGYEVVANGNLGMRLIEKPDAKLLSLVAGTKAGVRDETASWGTLGVDDSLISEVTGVFGDVDNVESILNIGAEAQSVSFAPTQDFLDAAVGLGGIVMVAKVGDQDVDVFVKEPENGWALPAGGVDLDGFAQSLQTGLDSADVEMEVSVDDGKIVISAKDDSPYGMEFGVDTDKLLRATSLEGLVGWVNQKLGEQVEFFENVKLLLTENGELMFDFPELDKEFELANGDKSLRLEDVGLASDFADVNLSAKLKAALSIAFKGSVGVNLIEFGDALLGGGDGSALGAANKSAAAQISSAFMENAFFQDVTIDADFNASADSVTGSAKVGMLDVHIGSNDASKNFVAIDTHMGAALVGESGSDFSNRVTLKNFADAFTYEIDGEKQVSKGINNLFGNVSMTGGLVTNGAGKGVYGSNNETLGDLTRADSDFTETTDKKLAQMVLRLGDVSVDVAGIDGINDDIITGVSITIDDLADPINTANYELLGAGADSVNALKTIGEGDILDSFGTILDMVKLAGDALKSKIPFLDDKLPLLNFSILDAVDFSEGLNDSLKELRDNPQSGLDKIKAALEDVFGQDTVTLEWKPDAKLLDFGLKFEFLKDYARDLPFSFDLEALVGDQLTDMLGADVAKVLTSMADVSGDGGLVFDPDLTMNLAFGMDLSKTLLDAADFITEDTPLNEIATVGSVKESASGVNDVRIKWTDTAPAVDPASAPVILKKTMEVDISGAKTFGEVLSKIDAAAKAQLSDTVSLSYDETTGQITLSDTNTDITLTDDVTAMFGSDDAASEEAPNGGIPVADGEFVAHTLEISETDFAAARTFTLWVGGADDLSESVEVTLEADAARTTVEAFAEALNSALKKASISRGAYDGDALRGTTISVHQLVRVEVENGTAALVTTNFAHSSVEQNIVLRATGQDVSHDVTFTVEDLGGSNVARLLGFSDLGQEQETSVTTIELRQSQEVGAPRVYLDTLNSGLRLEIDAGGEDLNLQLALGPFQVAVVDGVAKLTSSPDSTDPAFLALTFNDIDNDAHANQYDMAHVFDLVNDPQQSFADLFSVDMGVAVNVEFGFEDTLGLMDPEEDGFAFKSNLLSTDGVKSLQEISDINLSDMIKGDMANLANGLELEGDFDLNLPDLSDALSNFNVMALLNDPRAVIGGLDMILGRMQAMFDDYLADIDLPIVGDAIGSGVTFFDDFRTNILEKARVIAETPNEDGSLPTTIDLLTGWFNTELNNLLGTSDIQFVTAALNTDGGMTDSYLYGAINFSAKIFDEMLDIAFDLGVPGFALDVEKGSKINLALDYTVNLGFGLNKSGFFLLNDTDKEEVSIDFTVDAGTFQGSAKMLGILGISVDAINIDADGNVTGDTDTSGTAKLNATLGADLYGDQGLTIVDDATTDATEINVDLSGIDLTDDRAFEKLIYVSSLDAGDLVKFTFNADVDIQLGLTGQILDPTADGFEAFKVGGYAVIPTVKSELVVQANYGFDTGLEFTKVGFQDVRVDAQMIYDAILRPILEPIKDFIGPVADAFAFLKTFPFDLIGDVIATAYPIFGIIEQIGTIIGQAAEFADTLAETGGEFVFGDFDFTGSVNADKASGSSKKLNAEDAILDTSGGSSKTGASGNEFGKFGNFSRGLGIELPLLTDPFSAINLLTGKYDAVDLVKLHATLMDFSFGPMNPATEIVKKFGGPGWVTDALESFLKAEYEMHAKAKLVAGYDLSGIVNFVNTLDMARLLDGVFLDADTDLIDVGFGIDVELNMGIAKVTSRFMAEAALRFNDPNDDGKLRISELVDILDAIAEEPTKFFGYMFEGSFEVDALLKLKAGFTIPIINKHVGFSKELISFKWDETIGGYNLPTTLASEVDAGETAILAIGSNMRASNTSVVEDGNDHVVLDGPNSPITVNLNTGGQNLQGTLNQNAGGLIIPAGEGNNVVDMSMLFKSAHDENRSNYTAFPTVTYAAGGNDKIILPVEGIHVVFAGEGNDVIEAADGAEGTYIIFAGKGDDQVNIQGGNVIVFGDDDFGMRDQFLNEFKNGGVSEAKIRAMIGINADGTVDQNSTSKMYRVTDANGDTAQASLAEVTENFTQFTQLKASKGQDNITVGAGNHLILTGAGGDVIKTNGQTGVVEIYSGAGTDTISAGGASLYVEAGAGADLVEISAVNSEVWGWGKQAGASGQLDDGVNKVVNSLALRDGADTIIGGEGNDEIYGQLGSDLIIGGMGADDLFGGKGQDIIAGGFLDITNGAGDSVNANTYRGVQGFGQSVTLASVDTNDGADTLSGGFGDDLLIGGGDNDTISGDYGADALFGDFAKVEMSRNLVIGGLETIHNESNNAGTDDLRGGQGDDVIIAGGSSVGIETIVDTQGSNIILGDFGIIEGARPMEQATLILSQQSVRGGADKIVTGSGNDIIIGGEGDDEISTGLGGDIVIGDLGRVDIKASKVSTIASLTAGNDTITVGNGTGIDIADIVLAGGGSDNITGGAGGLTLLADDGDVTLNPIKLQALREYLVPGSAATAEQLAADKIARAKIAEVATVITSNTQGVGGDDIVNTEAGFVRGALGGGNDTATLGDFESYVLGDDGQITVESVEKIALQADGVASGNDTINSGNKSDFIIAGRGDDTINAAEGDDVILADDGRIDITGPAANRAFVARGDSTVAGADVVTGGNGNVTAIMGAGADKVTLGDGNSVVIGDLGQVRLDGHVVAETLEDSLGSADIIKTGTGQDVVIGGAANDTVDAGDGDNWVLGDSGSYDADKGLLNSNENSADGNDTIATGSGHDAVIAGGADDIVNAGSGDNWVIGDSGRYSANEGILTSAFTTRDGKDTVTTLEGDDRVILGGADDFADLGDGRNRVFGDSGALVSNANGDVMTTTHADKGGDDVINTGAGGDYIIAGFGSDTIEGGHGDNVVVGDTGTLKDDSNLLYVGGVDIDNGAKDTITTQSGRDVIIAGLGGDTVTTGAGDDAILGDLGHYSGYKDGTLSKLVSTNFTYGTGDEINSGADNDIVIAGNGDDVVNVGSGEDFAAGDAAEVFFKDTHQLELIDLLDKERGGNDHITAEGAGDDILIGQSGDDFIDAADGDDLIIGDLAEITLGKSSMRLDGQSVADRLVSLESIRPDLGAKDYITGGHGNDIIFAGHGDDEVYGEEGDDLLVADAAILKRAWVELADKSVFEKMTVDTNFAYLQGGYDKVFGGAGNDIMIGGLGPDLFFGDTEEDLIYSDGAAMLLHAVAEKGFKSDPMPKRSLFTSNMAGPGAIDLVSSSQLGSSIGTPFDLVPGNMPTIDRNDQQVVGLEEDMMLAQAEIQNFLTYVSDGAILEAIARLLRDGASDDLIMEALMREIEDMSGGISGMSPVEIEMMIRQLTEQMRESAQNVELAAGIAAE